MSEFTFIVGGEGVLSFDIVSGPDECFAVSQSFQLVKYVDALVVMTTWRLGQVDCVVVYTAFVIG